MPWRLVIFQKGDIDERQIVSEEDRKQSYILRNVYAKRL